LPATRFVWSVIVAALLLAGGACSTTPTAPDAGESQTSSTGSGTSGAGTGPGSTGSATGTTSSASGSGTAGSGTSGAAGPTGSSGTSGGSSHASSTGGGTTGGTTGPSCAGPGEGCAPLGCCAGLSCDAQTDLCALPCGVSDDGGPCVSLADCLPPLVCDTAGDAGFCEPPGPAPTLACAGNGDNCGGSLPICCGGPCVGINCVPRSTCGLQGAACSRDSDCCLGLACAQGDAGAGSCTPSCGGDLAPCQSNADCCRAKGFSCLGSGPGAFCYPEDPHQPFDADAGRLVECGDPCSGYQCSLGAGCQTYFDADAGAVVDPCAAAGLVCDATYAVCRQPGEFEGCAPGGPACQPVPNSSVGDLQCMTLPTTTGTIDLCVQPCQQTEDCADDLTTCQSLGAAGSFCYYDFCTNYFASCNSRGTNDGLCLPLQAGGQTYGFCQQGAITGGHAASACLSGANRQVGGQCDTSDVCVDDLCVPICNAGISGGPSCGPGDGGLSCLAIFGQSGFPQDTGGCGRSCDFTSADAGCTPEGARPPQKCVPLYLLGLGDLFDGVCVLGPDGGVAVGDSCLSLPTAGDPCVSGALCLNTGATGSVCAQLCDPAAPTACDAGQVCIGFASQGFASQTTGYCEGFLGDGGVWF